MAFLHPKHLSTISSLTAAVRLTQHDLDVYTTANQPALTDLRVALNTFMLSPRNAHPIGWDVNFQRDLENELYHAAREDAIAQNRPFRGIQRPWSLIELIDLFVNILNHIQTRLMSVDYATAPVQTRQQVAANGWNYRLRDIGVRYNVINALIRLKNATRLLSQWRVYIPRNFYKGENRGRELHRGTAVEFLEHFVEYLYYEMGDELQTNAQVLDYVFRVDLTNLNNDGTITFKADSRGNRKFATGVHVIWDGLNGALRTWELYLYSFWQMVPHSENTVRMQDLQRWAGLIQELMNYYLDALARIHEAADRLPKLLPALRPTVHGMMPLPRPQVQQNMQVEEEGVNQILGGGENVNNNVNGGGNGGLNDDGENANGEDVVEFEANSNDNINNS